MCGIAGMIHLDGERIPQLARRLRMMNDIQAHRGPDGHSVWVSPDESVGLAHRRLAIVDLSDRGAQPMVGQDESVLVHNGEVYNFVELRAALSYRWTFRSATDTEVILAAHARHGDEAVERFRGMFAYGLWRPRERRLTLARDPFGIKPLYYAQVGRLLMFSSEAKTLLPFLPDVETDPEAFAEYVALQIPLSERTLFAGVCQLPAGHTMVIENGHVRTRAYWRPEYAYRDISQAEAVERLEALVEESLALHLRSDVPVGAYLSGGVDSSLIAIMAAEGNHENRDFFHGKFTEFPGYDESGYAREAAASASGRLHEIDITASDFIESMPKVIYHLDQPVAGPGSFPQYMVSKLAGEHVKVVLGGQGGDEIFGGYSRYMVGYLEQGLRAAIQGEDDPGLRDLPLASILPQLSSLREYQPLIKSTWSSGLFGPFDERYLRLINRTVDMAGEVELEDLPMASVAERFTSVFNEAGVGERAYFDKMMRFDMRFLLPALLQVEDRMGMAHGLESRVPFLDRPLVEFVASLSPAIKLTGGVSKNLLRQAFGQRLPPSLLDRRDKMGFPVPLKEWFGGELRSFVHDTFNSARAGTRPWVRRDEVLKNMTAMGSFSRTAWGMLSLELWYQQFHDVAHQKRQAALALAG
ncbi:asparagine synthase (glutamine-hydrolyzing) [Caulobacter soli]|uniref:asparagine synthase (glutamine-hydrolyzing) n=1 Tax=Caulobacter soli TaxID=2708539 RepID=UPI00248377B3|nr:asparagine synthase (glutamine-hydrolyzing) [Caulobacter soli]